MNSTDLTQQKQFGEIQTFIEKISLKHQAPDAMKLIPLDFMDIIDEYCRFIQALSQCRNIAEHEYSLIVGELKNITILKNNIEILRSQLGIVNTVDSVHLGDEKINQKECSDTLNNTMKAFSDSFLHAVNEIEKHITAEVGELKKFKVVLFGRTKVGKSTIREALTQGNGETIGKGGQSTTINVNEYNWYNLHVFDTPGILSSKDTNTDKHGIGDEEHKAYELLKRSDIALFMFASDNIEEPELRYLQEIASAGKEILVLLNVKSDISDYRMYQLRKKSREIDVAAQAGHIKRIIGAVNQKLVILPIHAQAGFFSRAKNNPEVEAFFVKYGVGRNELYILSKFGEIRNFLVKNILGRGRYIRCQTLWGYFIAEIRLFANDNRGPVEMCKERIQCMQNHILRADKKLEEIIWNCDHTLSQKIDTLAKEKIDSYEFARTCIENKYEKERITSEWKEKLKVLNDIPGQIIQEFQSDVLEVFTELKKTLEFESKVAVEFDGYEIEMDLSPLFKGAGIALGIAGSVIAIGIALNWWNPAGWILAAVAGLSILCGWIGGLFKSKQTKITELWEKLDGTIKDGCKEMQTQLSEHLRNNEFMQYRSIMSDMKDAQKRMSGLCDQFLQLNDSLLAEAEKHEKYLSKRLQEIGCNSEE